MMTSHLPYDKNSLDRKLVKRIQGLSFLNEDSIPDRRSSFQYSIDLETSSENIELFLKTLPDEFGFMFFDLSHESVSDPGAYVFVQKSEDSFAHYSANSGWETKWKRISKKELTSCIYKNKGCQKSNFIEIRRTDKKFVLGQYPNYKEI